MSLTSRRVLLCSVLAALATSACDKVPLLAPTNSTIRVATGIGVLPVGGSTELTAIVIESAGTPVQNGTVVTFTSSLGTVEPREARTQNGQAIVRFVAGTQSGAARISAFSGGAKSDDVEILVGAAAAGALTLRADPAFVPATGAVVRIIAQVIDRGGNPLAGVSVGFAAAAGILSQSAAITNANGDATVELATNVQTVVTATVGGSETVLTANVTVAARELPSLAITLAGTGQAVEAGLPVVFTLTPSSGAGIRSARIDFGDGNGRDLGGVPAVVTAAHTYQRAGTYVVTAYATDAFGLTGTTTFAVVVTDRSTVPVTIQVISSINGLVTFSVSTTGAISGSIRTYEWDFGDSTSGTTTTGPQTSHRYTGTGTFVVRVYVTTTTGQQGFGEVTIRL